MSKLCSLLIVTVILCVEAFSASAQSFDLRPQTTQDKKADEVLLKLLEHNDVAGMKTYLSKNNKAVNANSRVIKSKVGAKIAVPLFYDAVRLAIDNEVSPEMCEVIINAGCDLHPVFDGMTPIYLVMEHLATHKIDDCKAAMVILNAFASRDDWDANSRYRSELPPINYLIRRNYEYLNNKFSKDYISDEVLEILLNHGASATSYTDEGQTLMSFAIETDNKYLQSYFLKIGVNLMHLDEDGTNDLNRMISAENLPLLKESHQRGLVNLNINTLTNEPKEFAHNKALYDYVSNICAERAETYEDLVLFRKRFDDKKQLVNLKYETMAREEANAANDFFQIKRCEERFPDLSSITYPRKLEIYHKDCEFVDNIFMKVCIEASGLDLYYRFTRENRLDYFLDAYEKNNFDPDNFVPKALDVSNVYAISKAANWVFGDYARYGGWDNGLVQRDRDVVRRGLKAAQQPCSEQLKSFFDLGAEGLRDRNSHLEDWISSQYRYYLAEKKKREEEYETQRTIELQAQKDWNDKMSSDNAGYYILQKVVDWGEWSHWRIFDTDDDFKDSRTIRFEGGKEVTVYWLRDVKNGINQYGFKRALFKSDKWYNNFEDAVIGAYLYDYEDKSWDHGSL